jgi:AcrR family transcriptional regulator
MSPRGVAIPHVREQLFDAAERLLREDAGPLSGRAVTREAGCAAGLLHNHFGDFDAFLVEFVIDRFRRYASSVTSLPSLAGAGTVAGNLTDAVLALFGPGTRALSRLLMSHPSIAGRAVQTRAAEGPARPMLEAAFATYLDREQQLGRVAGDADTEAIAVALLATVHQLLLTPGRDGQDARDLLRRVVATLVRSVAQTTSPT